jgi:hypothetical protein
LDKLKPLYNAWIDILCERSKKYIQGEKPKFTANFEETKNSVIGANDVFQDFIDSHLEITGNDTHRIDRHKMLTEFLQFARHNADYRKTKSLTLIDKLKDKKLIYKSDWRHNGTKGVFVGVKLQEQLPVYVDADSSFASPSISRSVSLQLTPPSSERLIREQSTKIQELNDELDKARKEILALRLSLSGNKSQGEKKEEENVAEAVQYLHFKDEKQENER